MNIPNIPSANLYRFKSILGLVVISTSVFFITYLIVDYNQKSVKVNSEIELLNLDIDNLSVESDKIINQTIAICELNNCKCIDERGNLIHPLFEKGPPIINRKQNELKDLYAQYEIVSKKVKTKNLKISTRNNLLDNYWRFSNWFLFIVIVILIIGFILVFTGFRDWRDKIQKYQDVIIQAQAMNLNSNIQQILPKTRRRLS